MSLFGHLTSTITENPNPPTSITSTPIPNPQFIKSKINFLGFPSNNSISEILSASVNSNYSNDEYIKQVGGLIDFNKTNKLDQNKKDLQPKFSEQQLLFKINDESYNSLSFPSIPKKQTGFNINFLNKKRENPINLSFSNITDKIEKNNSHLDEIRLLSDKLLLNDSVCHKKLLPKISDKRLNDTTTYKINNNEFISIQFKCNYPKIMIEKKVSKRINIKEIKEYLITYLKEFFQEDCIEISLLSCSKVLDNDKTINQVLEDYNEFLSDERFVNLDIKYDHFQIEMLLQLGYNQVKANNIKGISSNVAKTEIRIPIKISKQFTRVKDIDLPKTIDFLTFPKIPEIYNMTYDEIENVQDFEIYNEYGSIYFPGKTNIKGLNIDNIIRIEPYLVSVYKIQPELKPKIGEGLNKKANITLKNIVFNNMDDLLKAISSVNGEFISYKDKELKFSKENFE